MEWKSFIPKPLRAENYSYYSSLSPEEFLHKLKRATAPKPFLIRDSNFSGTFNHDSSSFRIFSQSSLYRRPSSPQPLVYVTGNFSGSNSRVRVEVSISVVFSYLLFSFIFSLVGLFVSIGNLSIYRNARWSEVREFLIVPSVLILFPLFMSFLAWFRKKALRKMFIKEFSLYPAID